jgi:protein SCO1/2
MLFFWSPEKKLKLLATNTATKGGEFTLDSSNGKVSLNQFKDKVVLIYFGYTWCPDVCPTNLSMLASALSQLTENEKKQVQGIFISVDPDRDNVQRLAEYTHFFHEKIIGLTGTKEQIDDIAKRYGVSFRLVKQDSATDYVVDHSSETYVIDKQGKLQEALPHAALPDQILVTIRKYL